MVKSYISAQLHRMNKLIIICLLILFAFNSKSQDCLPDGITFTRQSQIDSFRILYPGCIKIIGDVTILFNNNIWYLDSLDHIQFIDGDLKLSSSSDSLISLKGFHDLTHVQGVISIFLFSSVIDSILGFENLRSIGGGMNIEHMGSLKYVNAFSELQWIGEDLVMDVLPEVHTIIAFGNLTKINGDLYMNYLNKLSILDGFMKLDSIGGDLELSQFAHLNDHNFFPQLKYTGGQLYLYGIEMHSITGFASLTSTGSHLRIEGSPQLKYLDAFENLTKIDGQLQLNQSLDTTKFEGFPQLRNVGGDIRISNCLMDTLLGFNSLDTIEGALIFQGNDSLIQVNAFSQVNYLKGDLTIIGHERLRHFKGLTLLDKIHTNFEIQENLFLDSIDSFQSLDTITFQTIISHNENLHNLHFLPTLIATRDLYVQNNTGLQSLDGLQQLRSVSNEATISDNSSLKSMFGLQNLQFVGPFFRITDNDSLISLNGLDNLDSIYWGFRIERNPSLVDLSALNRPIRVRYFLLNENNSLIDFPYIGSLKTLNYNIENNAQLKTVSSEDGIEDLANVEIINNDSLQLINLTVKRIGTFVISGNDALLNFKGLDSLQRASILKIENNINLASFEGLTSLDSVRFDFTIIKNPSLIDFTGINNSSLIGLSNFVVDSNISLTSFNGLSSLRRTNTFRIIDNPQLNSLSGLSSLEKTNTLQIANNPLLASLEGAPKLSETGYLYINDNANLTDLSGLQSIITVDGLEIQRNVSLQSLDGLNAVQRNNDDLRIINNPVLQDISAISNIFLASHNGANLEISQNPLLSVCAVPSICEFFLNSNRHTIDSNAIGCNSVTEVESQCLTSTKEISKESLPLFPNPAENEIYLLNESFNVTDATYFIYDQVGKLVEAGEWHGAADLNSLSSGLYTLLIKADSEIRQGRFLKN